MRGAAPFLATAGARAFLGREGGGGGGCAPGSRPRGVGVGGRWGTPHPCGSPTLGPEELMHGWLNLPCGRPELDPSMSIIHPKSPSPRCHDDGLGAVAFPGDVVVAQNREGRPEPP